MSEASRCCEYHHHDIITVITRPQVCDPCLGDGACNEKICERNTIVICKTVHQVCLYHHHRSIYFTITLIGFLSSSSNLKMHRIISYNHHISHHIVSQLQILNEKDDIGRELTKTSQICDWTNQLQTVYRDDRCYINLDYLFVFFQTVAITERKQRCGLEGELATTKICFTYPDASWVCRHARSDRDCDRWAAPDTERRKFFFSPSLRHCSNL